MQKGILLKDGIPFFPIGFVFGTDDASLAQAAAIGCNAVHFEVGWNVAPSAGPVDESAFITFGDKIKRAGDWGFAAFPLLTGHYVPDWFLHDYPQEENKPLGSDGKGTGDWFPYSIHFPAMREAIQPFWKGAAQVATTYPNVVCMNLWNEPCYGGTWNKGSQYADYSKWGLADWRKELQGKYPEIQQLNQAFGTTFESWNAVQPPNQPDQFGRKYWLAWMEYGQRYFAGFFSFERSVVKGVAPDLMLANKKQTNLWDQSSASSGTNWKLLGESEDVSGLDMYTGSPFLSRTIMDGACSYAEGKPVMLFEVNTVPPNAAARTPDVIRTVLWAPLAGGARGMFIWGLVNDPESGLLNDQAASPEARAEYARLIRSISIHQREFASPRLQGKIGVLYSTTGALQYGKDTIPNYAMGAFDLFRNSHFQVDFIPEEDLNDNKLSGYRLVVLPSYCILRDAGKEAVGKYLYDGGHILCFADALMMDENLVPTPLPDWLGINAPKPAIGDHSNQRIGKTDEKLAGYLEDEIQISGVELISAMDNPQQNLIQGAQIKTKTTGDVLAYNSDSYPAIVATNGDRVVYCAFHSAYSSSLRGLMEGIARSVFGLRQEVRLVGVQSQFTDSSLITGVRSDYKDPHYRYLLVINTQFRPRNIKFEFEGSWRVEKELLHPEKSASTLDTYEFAPREVYLFTLTDHKQ